ncbi:MAG: hypothetical protein ACKVU1_16330 [bacterium]
MKTQHSAHSEHEEVRRAPARSGFARAIAVGAVASAIALTSIAPASAAGHKSRSEDRAAKRNESGARVERGEKRGESGARVERGERRPSASASRDKHVANRADSPRTTPDPRREWRDDGRRDSRDDGRNARTPQRHDTRYAHRDDGDDDDKKRGKNERHDWSNSRGRDDDRSDWRSHDDRRRARSPRDVRHVDKWSSHAEKRFRASLRSDRYDCFEYRPVRRAPHRVVKWCDRNYYDYANLNVYLPRFWIDFVIVDSAPSGYVFYDPYCDEFFPTVSAFRRHMRHYDYDHSAALDVVWIGDVERDPWYVECASGPSWSVDIHF